MIATIITSLPPTLNQNQIVLVTRVYYISSQCHFYKEKKQECFPYLEIYSEGMAHGSMHKEITVD